MMARQDKITISTPTYWAEACKHLVKKDRVMKRLIPQFGDACLQSRGDAFVTLARSIVGQQISVKAAQSVWDKFALLPRKITPANVLKLKVDDMRAAGLSARKIEYLVDLAINFDSGSLHVGQWTEMDDELIINENTVGSLGTKSNSRLVTRKRRPPPRHAPDLLLNSRFAIKPRRIRESEVSLRQNHGFVSPFAKCGIQLFSGGCVIGHIPKPSETGGCSPGDTHANLRPAAMGARNPRRTVNVYWTFLGFGRTNLIDCRHEASRRLEFRAVRYCHGCHRRRRFSTSRRRSGRVDVHHQRCRWTGGPPRHGFVPDW